ncbi:MAG: DCL family protein [Proteobacteria bacterium]|nr:DCL family protein [Pseudomonadota bacterium]
MPTAIPVVLDHKRFDSQNQARLHFSEMLNRYQPGQTLTKSDATELQSLLKRHPLHGKSMSTDIDHIDVTRTGFGRQCFKAIHPNNTSHTLSFIHCIRHSGSPPEAPPSPVSTKKTSPSTPPPPAQAAGDAQAPPATEPAKETAQVPEAPSQAKEIQP